MSVTLVALQREHRVALSRTLYRCSRPTCLVLNKKGVRSQLDAYKG